VALSKAILYCPDDVDLLFLYAQSLFKSGELFAAIPLLDQVLEKKADCAYAWKLKAEIEQALGREEEASRAVEEALRQIPDDPSLLLAQATSKYENELYTEGLDLIRRVIDKSPENPQAWSLYAELLWMTGDHHAAAAAYEHVLAFDDANAKAWFLRGDSLQNAGRFEEAAVAHERAFSLGGDPRVGLLLSKR
jgi:Flp pilus assembly protein TadD